MPYGAPHSRNKSAKPHAIEVEASAIFPIGKRSRHEPSFSWTQVQALTVILDFEGWIQTVGNDACHRSDPYLELLDCSLNVNSLLFFGLELSIHPPENSALPTLLDKG